MAGRGAIPSKHREEERPEPVDPRSGLRVIPDNPRNFCTCCHRDFSSLRAFDDHRRGPYEPYDRHCLNEDGLRAEGFALNTSGRWEQTARSARARRIFADKGKATAHAAA